MKSVDPTERKRVAECDPSVIVYYVQPFGVTVPADGGKKGFFNLYLDNFINRIEGLEIPDEHKHLPWSRLMPPPLANEMFTEISSLAHLEDEEKEG